MNHAYLLPQYLSSGVHNVVEPYSVVDNKAMHYVKNHSQNKGKVIVFGYTHKSQHLCKILKKDGEPVRIYENSEENQQKAVDDGFSDVLSVNYENIKYLDDISLDKNNTKKQIAQKDEFKSFFCQCFKEA